jgi:hypothetical protein
MRHARAWMTALGAASLLCGGCPGDTEIADGSAPTSDGGRQDPDGGSGSGTAGGGNSSGSGASGSASAGNGGAGCPDEIPAICRVCADGSCGEPVCVDGRWSFRCAEDTGTDCPDEIPTICLVCADGSCGEPVCVDGGWTFRCGGETDAGVSTDAGSACQTDDDCPGVGACPACPNSQSCAELTCVEGACRFTCDTALRWYVTCGDPVCGLTPDPFDDPNIPNCVDEQTGDPCSERGAQCDGTQGCGAMLICSDSDPTMQFGGCPRSRARYKQDIAYLSSEQLDQYHAQLVRMPLASWRYRTPTDASPQLGFIIEDVEPSAAVNGDRVNMYGYLSMAVAAIQVQQGQIHTLEAELQAVRDQLAAVSMAAPLCGP